MNSCPNCSSESYIKSGMVNNRQLFKCKECNYYFSVNKLGKKIDDVTIIEEIKELYIVNRVGIHQ